MNLMMNQMTKIYKENQKIFEINSDINYAKTLFSFKRVNLQCVARTMNLFKNIKSFLSHKIPGFTIIILYLILVNANSQASESAKLIVLLSVQYNFSVVLPINFWEQK